MPLAEDIRQRYPAMTGALKSFADFVLSHPVSAARLSIRDAVKEAGVSVATAHRFAKALGYESYPAFRAALIGSFGQAFEPVRRLEKELSRASEPSEIMARCLKEDISNLQKTVAMVDPDSVAQAVRMILDARSILVVGFDNGGCLAQILANGLMHLKDDVATVGLGGGGLSGVRKLCRMDSSDLVIAIAFPRYIRDSVRLSRLAKAQGVPVLAITDSHRSPLAVHASLSLFVSVHRQYASLSNAAALALMEALVAAVAHGSKESLARAEAFTNLILPWIEDADAPVGGGTSGAG